jgi:hypothetical protein
MLRRVLLLQRFGLLPRPTELGFGDYREPGLFPGPGAYLSGSSDNQMALMGRERTYNGRMAALQFVAVMCSALFAGAALYVSIIEHPARMSAGISIALQEFRPSYRRAAVFQVSMAVIAFVCSFALSLFTSRWIWFLGGGMTGLMLPFTLIFMMPTNRILLDAASPLAESDAQNLLDRWGRLHLIRTIAGMVGFAILLGYSVRTF